MSAYREGQTTERIAELERALSEAKEREADLERQLWAARRRVKAASALHVTATMGLGSLVGTLAGLGAWLGTDNPTWLWSGALVGALFGLIVGAVSREPGEFPAAPKERLPHG